MKRRQIISAIVLGFAASISSASHALAQDAEDIPPVLATIIVKTSVIFDGLLDYWVNAATGNTVSEPMGNQLLELIAQMISNAVHFLAQLITLF